MQTKIITCYDALTKMVIPQKKDYQKAMDSVQRVEGWNDIQAFKALLNFQDANKKTLIHHIIENPDSGSRSGLWMVIELNQKGAKFLRDSLGNTALHSCAILYMDFMQKQVATTGLTAFASRLYQGLIPVNPGERRPADERIMFALMADVGAMLFCGADPLVKNNKGEEVFGMMASVASMLKSGSAKPNICEASCKKAFLEYSSFKKPCFVEDPILKRITYPWATNVVSWVDNLKVDDSVKNASLTASTCALF